MQKKGTKLNEDQLLAVSKYDEVIRSLELSRELEKQFVGLANDVRPKFVFLFFFCSETCILCFQVMLSKS